MKPSNLGFYRPLRLMSANDNVFCPPRHRRQLLTGFEELKKRTVGMVLCEFMLIMQASAIILTMCGVIKELLNIGIGMAFDERQRRAFAAIIARRTMIWFRPIIVRLAQFATESDNAPFYASKSTCYHSAAPSICLFKLAQLYQQLNWFLSDTVINELYGEQIVRDENGNVAHHQHPHQLEQPGQW